MITFACKIFLYYSKNYVRKINNFTYIRIVYIYIFYILIWKMAIYNKNTTIVEIDHPNLCCNFSRVLTATILIMGTEKTMEFETTVLRCGMPFLLNNRHCSRQPIIYENEMIATCFQQCQFGLDQIYCMKTTVAWVIRSERQIDKFSSQPKIFLDTRAYFITVCSTLEQYLDRKFALANHISDINFTLSHERYLQFSCFEILHILCSPKSKLLQTCVENKITEKYYNCFFSQSTTDFSYLSNQSM